jgi:hypothetical protein
MCMCSQLKVQDFQETQEFDPNFLFSFSETVTQYAWGIFSIAWHVMLMVGSNYGVKVRTPTYIHIICKCVHVQQNLFMMQTCYIRLES